jgi:cysteine desulfurase / selenocysteine lyase
MPVALSCPPRTFPVDGCSIDVADVRNQFPIFSRHPGLVFLDNAATTQKPSSVIDVMDQFYRSECTNAGRASYRWSTRAARSIEAARYRVAQFINAEPEELVFTSGATDSLNMVAQAWGLKNLGDGDEVMLCYEDHKSAVLPWLNLQRVLASFGKHINIVPIRIDSMGDYHFKSIEDGLSRRTRLVAVCHVHHLHGLDMEVNGIRDIVGEDVAISLDASQSVGHMPVDVRALAVDFLSFSGHKMFAANGTVVLWVDNCRQRELGAARVGGGQDTEGLRDFFEAGSQNIPGILSMEAAIEFIDSVGIDRIASHVSDLTFYLRDRLQEFQTLEFSPGIGICNCPTGHGILSFRFENIKSSDMAFLLDSENIFVRNGDHCIRRSGDEHDYLRASLHVYNSRADIDRLIEVLHAHVG